MKYLVRLAVFIFALLIYNKFSLEEVFDSIVSRRTDSKNERKGYLVVAAAADYAYPTLTSTDFELKDCPH